MILQHGLLVYELKKTAPTHSCTFTGRYIYKNKDTKTCQSTSIDQAVTLLDCKEDALEACVDKMCKSSGGCSSDRQRNVKRFECIATECSELDWLDLTTKNEKPPSSGAPKDHVHTF